MNDFRELARLSDHDQIYEVQRALVARDIEAEVWDEQPDIKRRSRVTGTPLLRLMVPERYLVYARWVAHAAGLDTWPDEQTAEDTGVEQREAA